MTLLLRHRLSASVRRAGRRRKLRLVAAACAEQLQLWRIGANGLPDTPLRIYASDGVEDPSVGDGFQALTRRSGDGASDSTTSTRRRRRA